MSYPAVILAPQVRGLVPPRVIASLADQGWRIHRVGQAAYLHSSSTRLIFGVWDRAAQPPTWAGRLGAASPGYERRWYRCRDEQRWRRLMRDRRGRWIVRLPWWKWPQPTVYGGPRL